MKPTKRIEVLTSILDELATLTPQSSKQEQQNVIDLVKAFILGYPNDIATCNKVLTADKYTLKAIKELLSHKSDLIPVERTLIVVSNYVEHALSELVD